MSDCCPPPAPQSCHPQKSRIDYLFWSTLLAVVIFYGLALYHPVSSQDATLHAHDSDATVFLLFVHIQEMVNTIWWGVLLGIVMIALLAAIPREFIISLLGTKPGVKGVLRATAAGVLLDLCSHGILMVGAKLYERGASIGQVMAFLIASPWNSFSLTLILIALIGLPWTLIFVALSMLIAISVGVLFDALTANKVLPANPHRRDLPEDFHFWPELRRQWRDAHITLAGSAALLWQGLKDSRMVLRWLLVGILLASLIRTFVDTNSLTHYFGASLVGLLLTMLAATIIEVCSEGSAPIAADLLNRAQAPGNGFAFLMAGVATDYTEVMVVKETTASWKIAFFMPLLTLPQVFAVAWLLNQA